MSFCVHVSAQEKSQGLRLTISLTTWALSASNLSSSATKQTWIIKPKTFVYSENHVHSPLIQLESHPYLCLVWHQPTILEACFCLPPECWWYLKAFFGSLQTAVKHTTMSVNLDLLLPSLFFIFKTQLNHCKTDIFQKNSTSICKADYVSLCTRTIPWKHGKHLSE